MPVSRKRKPTKRKRVAAETTIISNTIDNALPQGGIGVPRGGSYTGGNLMNGLKTKKFLGLDPNIGANDNKKSSALKNKKRGRRTRIA
jgi:hypothetical protein